MRINHYNTLPYTERTEGKYRDLRGIELRLMIPKRLRSKHDKFNMRNARFLRISVNGIHRQDTGFHFVKYRKHVWHLSFDWRKRRGISLSYGRTFHYGRPTNTLH